jgi:hypothetical protein
VRDWPQWLKIDPLSSLLSSGDAALVYFTRRDLFGEDPGPVERLWELPAVQKILKKQLPDGSWPRSGEKKHPAINYGLIETWRWFRYLVAQYGFTCQHPAAQRATEFLFSCQTEEGDFRGILANQVATYYTGAILALLIDAGCAGDPRVEQCFQWLLSMRQSSEYAEPLQLDRSKPFSHNTTGMILRAFAAHPEYRHSEAALTAARLLKSRFFQPDAYTSYQDASYWLRFEYPFWWNNLVSALDSLSLIGLSEADEHIRTALDWLIEHQGPDGLWSISLNKPDNAEKETAKVKMMKFWVSLAICRIFQRFYS